MGPTEWSPDSAILPDKRRLTCYRWLKLIFITTPKKVYNLRLLSNFWFFKNAYFVCYFRRIFPEVLSALVGTAISQSWDILNRSEIVSLQVVGVQNSKYHYTRNIYYYNNLWFSVEADFLYQANYNYTNDLKFKLIIDTVSKILALLIVKIDAAVVFWACCLSRIPDKMSNDYILVCTLNYNYDKFE